MSTARELCKLLFNEISSRKKKSDRSCTNFYIVQSCHRAQTSAVDFIQTYNLTFLQKTTTNKQLNHLSYRAIYSQRVCVVTNKFPITEFARFFFLIRQCCSTGFDQRDFFCRSTSYVVQPQLSIICKLDSRDRRGFSFLSIFFFAYFKKVINTAFQDRNALKESVPCRL